MIGDPHCRECGERIGKLDQNFIAHPCGHVQWALRANAADFERVARLLDLEENPDPPEPLEWKLAA